MKFQGCKPPVDLRHEVIRKWEEFYSSGMRIGGYPLSEHIQRHLVENGLGAGPVLELGCGTGRTFSHIMAVLQLHPPSQPVYVGADASLSALLVASRRNGIWPVLCDMFAQPFASESFRLIYARNVLEGYSASAAADLSREVYRLLRKGGFLLVEERGPLDRGIETSDQTSLRGRDDSEGRKSFAAIFSQFSTISFSEQIRRRRTAGGTVIIHTTAAVFRKG